MVIVGLLLTLWRLTAAKVVEPTPFLKNFDLQPLLEPVHKQARNVLNSHSTSQVYVQGHPKWGEFILKRKYLFDYHQDHPDPSELVNEIMPYVRSMLAKNDCEEVGLNAYTELHPRNFVVVYKHGDTFGIVSIDATTHDDEVEIFVIIHEFPAW